MSSSLTSSIASKARKKTVSPFKWARPKSDNDPPKKPLSSYNIFFLLERDRIIQGEPERVYTLEEVQRIVRVKRWDAKDPQKRRHRKAHGKISFHDLSQVVADKWRKLDESQKAIFNHQAAIEHKQYKDVMGQWVMKQMNSNYSQNKTQMPIRQVTAATVENDELSNKYGRFDSPCDAANLNTSCAPSVSTNTNKRFLSENQFNDLLGFFNNMPRKNNFTNMSSRDHDTNWNKNQKDCDLYHCKIDFDGPLWYNNAQGYSEEYALKMIESV